MVAGAVDQTHASVLHDCNKNLSDNLENKGKFDFELLIALAFIDVDYPGIEMGAGSNDATIEDYLEKAKGVLEKRPELRIIGLHVRETKA